jgi:CubicO group peptidase (beta-lactamase class C family)
MRSVLLSSGLALLLPAAGPVLGQSLADHPRVSEALNLLDLWIDAQVAYEQIPGASAALVHDQELLWSKGYGFANREERIPATPGTIYSICSISKLFTSVGVMRLRDGGRLRLDDSVADHLSWYRIEESYPEAGPATVQGLLTHSSGLPRESAHPYWSAPDFEFPTREEIIDRISGQETLYPTLTYFQYSNLGLSLAGEIVAATSGMPYDQYIREHILEPLGMTSTTPEIPAQLWGNRMALGYGALNRQGERLPMPMFQARGIAPAAGFASTVEDLAKFASWQFRLLETGTTEILGRNTLREMHRVHWVNPDWSTHWGLGFSVSRSGDKTFVGHGGSCPGYRSQLSLQTKDKIAAVFAANALGVTPSLYTNRAYEIMAPAIKKALAAASGGEESASEKTASEEEDPETTLEMYLGTYGQSFGGETAALVWEGKLALVSFPTENPLGAMTKLKHIEGHTFRRIRSDEELGEEISFEVVDGQVVRMWRNNNFTEKVR